MNSNSKRTMVWAVAALLGVAAQAADITFSTPVTITGSSSDVLATGKFCYAYAWNGASGSVTINGVSFTGTTTANGTIDGNVSLTQSDFYNGGGGNPMSAASSLPDTYKNLLGGVAYSGTGTGAETVTLRNLTVGHQYAVQVWANDSRGVNLNGTTVSGAAGSAAYIDYNTTDAPGGVGQFTVGWFVASATTQQVTLQGGQQYLNALQLRDFGLAAIYFTPAATITGNDSDILATGSFCYAYAWNGASGSVTINGVSFIGTTTANGTIDGNVSLTQAVFYNGGGGNPMSAASSLPDTYKNLLGGVAYSDPNVDPSPYASMVTLRNLTVGHQYAVQLWVNDSRGENSHNGTTVSSAGGNSVDMVYSVSNVYGGVGRFTVGWFVASAQIQQITLRGGEQYLNALQLRDFGDPGYWTGLEGSALDATSASFSTNALDAALAVVDLAAVKAGGRHALFADAYYYGGTDTPVTETNLTVAAGGVEAERLFVNNTAVDYTFFSADANGIKGASDLYKCGVGRLTLAGNNTYTGATAVLGGTLRVGDGGTAGRLGDTRGVALSKGATLVFDRSDAYGGNVSSVISGEGAVVVNGGYLALGGANIYTGPTTINGGTLEVTTIRYAPDVNTWGLLTINSNATLVAPVRLPFGYPSASQAGVDKLISFFVNGGTLSNQMPSADTLQYKSLRLANGTVQNAAYLLQYGDLSAEADTVSTLTGSGVLHLRKPTTDTLMTVGSNATLTISQSVGADNGYIGDATLGFTKQGAGTLVLAGNNTYAGKTTIQEGTLAIGAGGTAGTLGAGAVTNSAALVFNRSDSYGGAVNNPVSGSGSLTLASGALTLSGTNTYSGATVVSGGTLSLTHDTCLATNTAVSIASGAKVKLAFTGTNTVRSLTINGVPQTRNRLYSQSNAPAAFDSAGSGYLFVTEGPAARGTLISVF